MFAIRVLVKIGKQTRTGIIKDFSIFCLHTLSIELKFSNDVCYKFRYVPDNAISLEDGKIFPGRLTT